MENKIARQGVGPNDEERGQPHAPMRLFLARSSSSVSFVLIAAMFLATVSKPKQLLCLSFIDRVSVEELEHGRDDLIALLAELTTGFRLLADLSQLEFMDVDCAREIGKAMELIDQKGVALVVRIIPNPRKDIGLNMLSLFHYHHRPQTVTCESLVEAGEILGLGHSEDRNEST